MSMGAERPHRRAAEERDEMPTFHAALSGVTLLNSLSHRGMAWRDLSISRRSSPLRPLPRLAHRGPVPTYTRITSTWSVPTGAAGPIGQVGLQGRLRTEGPPWVR